MPDNDKPVILTEEAFQNIIIALKEGLIHSSTITAINPTEIVDDAGSITLSPIKEDKAQTINFKKSTLNGYIDIGLNNNNTLIHIPIKGLYDLSMFEDKFIPGFTGDNYWKFYVETKKDIGYTYGADLNFESDETTQDWTIEDWINIWNQIAAAMPGYYSERYGIAITVAGNVIKGSNIPRIAGGEEGQGEYRINNNSYYFSISSKLTPEQINSIILIDDDDLIPSYQYYSVIWTVVQGTDEFHNRKIAELKANKVYGAVFNDYAEYRECGGAPGRCVIEQGDGSLNLSSRRLELGANIVSDTFGFSIGKTEKAKCPIAVCGRVLAYPYEKDMSLYTPGRAVCSGPNGTISVMTREEIVNWPDAIVGYVSEVPTYTHWGTDNILVDGRVWIKIK